MIRFLKYLKLIHKSDQAPLLLGAAANPTVKCTLKGHCLQIQNKGGKKNVKKKKKRGKEIEKTLR